MTLTNIYSVRHEGETVLVCGSAPCLIEEYQEVMKYRPAAKVMAVNEAASGVQADFLVSYHAGKFNEFKNISLNKNITTHTARPNLTKEEEEQTDYKWDGVLVGATSAGDGIQIARLMGFSEIIMIGCPMNGGDGYFKETTYGGLTPRFGNPKTIFGNGQGMIDNHKSNLLRFKNKLDLSMVRSMSGYSAEVFGKWEA